MELNNIISQGRQMNLLAAISIISFLVFTACSEDPLKISPDTLPDSEMVDVYIDTLTVELYTISADALETQSPGTCLLGSVNDSVLGTLETDFFADFIYTDEPTFKDETDLDSIQVLDLIIDLIYNNEIIYGDFDTSDFEFAVYELLEPVPQYTKSDFTVLPHMYDPVPLDSSISFENETHDTYVAYDYYDTCYITLSNSFAQRFLDTVLINEEIYHSENQQNFKDHFKGFYFAVKPRVDEGGSIISIPQPLQVGSSTYYSLMNMTLRTLEWDADSSEWDTVSTVFSIGNPQSVIDTGGVYLNMYRNTLSANVAAVFNDTINQFSKAYIQSLSGPQVFVKLPTLSALREEIGNSVSVIRAQLILPVEMESYLRDEDIYSPPYRLGLLDGSSEDPILDDRLIENYLGGYIDTTSTDDYRYVLNIGNHLHEFLRDESSTLSNTFYLFAASPDLTNTVQYIRDRPARIVLRGSTSSNPPFVRMVYSKITE
jgi:hypothetical protein